LRGRALKVNETKINDREVIIMGVYKRLRKHKDGSETGYWYIRYWVNGQSLIT